MLQNSLKTKSRKFNDEADLEFVKIFFKKYSYKTGQSLRMDHYLECAGILYEKSGRPYSMCTDFVDKFIRSAGYNYL